MIRGPCLHTAPVHGIKLHEWGKTTFPKGVVQHSCEYSGVSSSLVKLNFSNSRVCYSVLLRCSMSFLFFAAAFDQLGLVQFVHAATKSASGFRKSIYELERLIDDNFFVSCF